MKRNLSILFAMVLLLAFAATSFADTAVDTSSELHLSSAPANVQAGAAPLIEVSETQCSHLSCQPEYLQAGAAPVIGASETEFAHLSCQPKYIQAGAAPVTESN